MLLMLRGCEKSPGLNGIAIWRATAGPAASNAPRQTSDDDIRSFNIAASITCTGLAAARLSGGRKRSYSFDPQCATGAVRVGAVCYSGKAFGKEPVDRGPSARWLIGAGLGIAAAAVPFL